MREELVREEEPPVWLEGLKIWLGAAAFCVVFWVLLAGFLVILP